ncbi:D-serine deaminase, pyridoxal phosphate-dependent [Pedobacter terrae]|uniref:D-serine deaminase, pyridoxal phosphate-dependent n=1 Tax=Pedobacter terrae TaxID=405671 RepID=A0A1G7YUI0_9SPHI|nr:D-TA family PLP-dependent enzyme [Pedobacter terrae]SDH00094.1 D-serine deaminase, pyridoxal phosphate-dependent [Pedobacter terrae]
MEQEQAWYLLPDGASIETPSLIFYEQRLKANISLLKSMIDRIDRLRPHVKTHKCRQITKLLLLAGINKFKCATIAEAEMLAMDQAPDVLLAYQPVGENISRFFKLKRQYPDTAFSCLVDHPTIAEQLSAKAIIEDVKVDVYIDLNVGMNRTGKLPDQAFDLVESLQHFTGLRIKGLHAYDGHIHDGAMEVRQAKSAAVIKCLVDLQKKLEARLGYEIIVVAGGTPTFPIYASKTSFECSPGTFILWDKGYQDAYTEQPFYTAALVASRVVSLPGNGLVCADLGHKAVAAEKELKNRVFFINAPLLDVQSQSEEHLVLRNTTPKAYLPGDMLYGLPYHVCPTVALYEQAICLKEDQFLEYWEIISRKRKITI